MVPKGFVRRITVYCADNGTTVQDFVTETLEKRLSQRDWGKR
jgi:hypothetical protein